MSRADQCSANQPGAESPLPQGSAKRHRRVRERRYHVSRQALGLEFFRLHPFGVAELVSSTPPPPPAVAATVAEAERLLDLERTRERCRKAIRICVVILLMLLLSNWIILFLREVPFAWPSLDSKF
jgi:hypothetical protein